MNLDFYDVIILDCDGVVFDSNLLKVKAFEKALQNYSIETVKAFSQYFQNNFGTSRYFLVKVFIKEFLNQDFDEKLYQEILENYGFFCVQLYKESSFTKNFLEFIKYYKDKKFYIASGGDEKELNEVFSVRGINHYFEEICGSPRKKSDLIDYIINKHPEQKILMIGDAKSDFLASQINHIDFIYMSQYSLVEDVMKKLSLEYHFNIINHLGDLIK